jgi:hypothetical protein
MAKNRGRGGEQYPTDSVWKERASGERRGCSDSESTM